ncbi:MAG: helix-turn-helix domain-containing protein [Alphaproteobacteria bacterium]|nr:helix-turn-helix domain-containing protein [Alphaproteobacteria bacterium]MBV8413197.1 helix-turn-helix domain-containing protein [Alphaproteobacteria bacterium]
MATRGPSSDYKPEYSDLARKFCMLGATDEELGRLFEVAPATIDDWREQVPDFSAALRAGREVADATIAERLHARAIGYSHPAVKIFQSSGQTLEVPYTEHYPPDVQACIFWLRNRRRAEWRDKADAPQGEADLLAELEAAGERARNARR